MVAAILHLNKGARFARISGDQMRRGLRDGHDVRNDNWAVRAFDYLAQQSRILFFMIAEYARDFGHIFEGFRFNLRRAAGYPHFCVGSAFMRLANGLAGLADRFIGHGAAVDNDDIVMPGKLLGQGVAFCEVQAATHADDFRFLQRGVHPKSSQLAWPVKT